jgi:purine-binding chemotaxis protein CheW
MDLPGPHTSVVEYASAYPHAGFPSRVCLITISNSLFAIDLQSIREVFPVDSVTPVPGMPTVLTGVTNLRGVVVPLVDVRPLLGLQHSGAPLKYAVVIHHDGNQVGVLVDQIPEIRTVQSDQFLPAPQTGQEKTRPFVSTILRIEERLGGLLQVQALLVHMDMTGAAGRNK